MVGWLVECLVGWLVWLVGWLVGWPVGWLVCMLVCFWCLVSVLFLCGLVCVGWAGFGFWFRFGLFLVLVFGICLVCVLAFGSVRFGWLAGWLVGWLVGWMVGWFVGLVASWLRCCFWFFGLILVWLWFGLFWLGSAWFCFVFVFWLGLVWVDGWVVGWLVGWLAVWVVDRSAGWLTGWFLVSFCFGFVCFGSV